MSHQEIQIAPGVYVTDFRPGGELKGLEKPKEQLTNDVGLLLDGCLTLESKSCQLQFTIDEIKKEEDWEKDGDFREAVEDNWKVLFRFCEEMRENIVKLADLKYQPETTKIEEMLDLERVEKREQRAREGMATFQKGMVECEVGKEEDDGGIYL